MRSGVKGIWVSRTPQASKIAFAIAGIGAFQGVATGVAISVCPVPPVFPVSIPTPLPPPPPLPFLELVDQRRHNLEQIPDDPVVGDFEDRRIAILVDRDDRA